MINVLYIYVDYFKVPIPKFLLCLLIFLLFYNELGQERLYIKNILRNSRVKTQV